MERQHAKWEKIFANHISHKELVQKELLQLNNKMTNGQILKQNKKKKKN